MSEQFGPEREEGAPLPGTQEGMPPHINPAAAQTGQVVRAVQDAVRQGLSDIKADLTKIETRSHTDYHRLLYIFGAGFLALAAMTIEAYRWGHEDLIAASSKVETRIEKTDDRVVSMGNSLSRIDQKLQDLLERIPPVQTPPPRR